MLLLAPPGTAYLIGVHKEGDEESDSLRHEIAVSALSIATCADWGVQHALYTTNPQYKEQIQSILSEFTSSELEIVRDRLRNDGCVMDPFCIKSVTAVISGMLFKTTTYF